MIKLTVLYGHPKDAIAFESYYAETHLPLVATMPGISKVEYTHFIQSPDGGKPAHYRMAEFWFENVEGLQYTMASPAGQATAADLENFASGGVTLMIGAVS